MIFEEIPKYHITATCPESLPETAVIPSKTGRWMKVTDAANFVADMEENHLRYVGQLNNSILNLQAENHRLIQHKIKLERKIMHARN